MCRSLFRIRSIPFFLAAWFVTAVIVSVAAAEGEGAARPSFVVTIDGQSISSDLLDQIADGSEDNRSISVGLLLKLGSERELHFKHQGTSGELIYVSVPGQPSRLVGVRVSKNPFDESDPWVNPLTSLSDAEIHGLWGLELDFWSDEIAQKVQQIDVDRTYVTIGEGVAKSSGHSLPPLPVGIKNLQIDCGPKDGLTNLDELRHLSNLRTLVVSFEYDGSFDCSLLTQATQLRFLQLSGGPLKNSAALEGLTQLQELDLSRCRDLIDLSFVKSMKKLKSLDLRFTRATDLNPLGGLPQLRAVNVECSRVNKLPGSMPSLREMNVISTQLTDQDVHAFRDSNPNCRVLHRWTQSLQTMVKPATKLRIRSGGTCHRDEAKEVTLFESKNAAEIKQLIAGIEIVESDGGGGCFCCGHPSFEFFEGDKLIVTLGFHHGEGFRWQRIWPGDGMLTKASREFLIDWLANRSITGPLRAVRETERRRRSDEKQIVRATTGMSSALSQVVQVRKGGYPDLLGKFRTVLKSEIPEQAQQIPVLLRLFGASNEEWDSEGFTERLADEQLVTYDVETLGKIVESALTGNDRQLRRGAARFWKKQNSPLKKWNPESIAKLHRIVVLVEQEARYYPLRTHALDDLVLWKNDFTNEEFNQRVTMGLHDPIAQVRRKAMLVAGGTGHQASIDLLMGVLKGRNTEPRPLPDVPPSESEDVSEDPGDLEVSRSDVDAASVALGLMGHAPAKPLIEALPSKMEMRDVALALLGDGERLKPEHFGTQSLERGLPRELQAEFQMAAVQAVIRFKGKYGLKLAIQYEQASHPDELREVGKKLGQMLREENARGTKEFDKYFLLYDLNRWFEDHGDQYLKRFEGP